MVFKIIVSPRAQAEIENAIAYYALYSIKTPRKFIASLRRSYSILETAPFFKFRYKNVRSLKIDKFPYSLYFVVSEKQQQVKILSCFHNKRNPESQPSDY